ncbi:YegP family protein [Vibrio cholerae]
MDGLDFLSNALLKRKGKYELLKSRDNKFYFVLKAPNGEIIATSEMYSSKQSAINGISSIKTNADSDMVDYT